MRIYFAASHADVEALAAGEALLGEQFVPDSEDESDEFVAFEKASNRGLLVIAADVDETGQPFGIDDVASFHVDLDGTGDLAWFATQEIDAVRDALKGPRGS